MIRGEDCPTFDVAALIEGLQGALAAAEAQNAELVKALRETDDALVAVINYRDADGNHPLDGPITIQVDRAISRSRAALSRQPAGGAFNP